MTGEIITGPGDMALAGQLANAIAGAGAMDEYRNRRAANTVHRQLNDLALFAQYLQELKQSPGDLANDPQAWHGITWGLVAGYVRWLLKAGYAVGSVNVGLSTIKTYATLAAQAGALDSHALAMIKTVKGYKRSEAKHIDDSRESTRRTLRSNGTRAYKKPESVSISFEQAEDLKAQPDTPQGRRDRLIMCLLLDHGLRVGELAGLTVDCFNLQSGKMVFYRPKVDKVQTHKLTPDTRAAAKAYLANDAPALGAIWRGSRKGEGGLASQGMTARAITQRVTDLGAALGINGLSAHDCRHYAATRYAQQVNKGKLTFKDFIDLFGWSSPAMALRYIESAQVIDVESFASV